MISLASRSGPSKQRAATPPPPSGYHYVGEKPENYSSILDTHFDRCVKSVIEAALSLHQERWGVK